MDQFASISYSSYLFYTASISDHKERYGLQASNDRRKFMEIARPLPSF